MRGAILAMVAAAAFVVPSATQAEFTPEDFYVRSAQDLVDICSVPSDSHDYLPAAQFCRGFVSGAWQYHEAEARGPKGWRLACPPDPPPTRDQAIAMFVTWTGTHPDQLTEPAVEALFRFLNEKYPCPATGAATKGGSK